MKGNLQYMWEEIAKVVNENVSGDGSVIEVTHAVRLASYPATDYPVGTLLYETDRTVLYVVYDTGTTYVWQYVSGRFIAIFADRPTDLGTYDRGFQLLVTVQNHVVWWSGTQWFFADQGGGYFQDFVAAPPALGWQLCDGTATDYLVISGAGLALTGFTTPNENGAATGVYHKSIAAYTNVINAPVAPALSGNVANSTATNQATTATNQAATATNQNTVVTAHPVVERLDVAGVGVFVFDNQADADHATHTHVQDAHNHTQDSHNHTQNAHNHAITGVTADTAAEPRNLGVLRYFRR